MLVAWIMIIGGLLFILLWSRLSLPTETAFRQPKNRKRDVVNEQKTIKHLVCALLRDHTDEGLRDLTILTILLELPLSVEEIAALRLSDIDCSSCPIHISVNSEKLEVSSFAGSIIRCWLHARGLEEGPFLLSYGVFCRLLPIKRKWLTGDRILGMLRDRTDETNVQTILSPHRPPNPIAKYLLSVL